MRAAFAIAALAGSAIAAPAYGQPGKQETKYVEHIEIATVYQTVYVTEGQEQPTTAPQPVYQAPAVTNVVHETKPTQPAHQAPPASSAPAPPASSAPAPSAYSAPAPQPEQPKPKPTSTATPSPTYAPASAPATGGYMDVVNLWRSKMQLPALTQDSTLEKNAETCVVASNGQMKHQLNQGTLGQVLAPTKMEGNSLAAAFDNAEFTHVYVGGWLCEKPDAVGLDGICQEQSKGWNYQGQDGHYKILSNPNYKKIGCAIYNKICACDLA